MGTLLLTATGFEVPQETAKSNSNAAIKRFFICKGQ
ncbi:hypothetical protein FIC_00835 [Flavobacteriaceae bacterium 3519-10]|nr:hypothetical protein FIC_00835 [Flavobacteriaceae bacterium 3519-10]